MERFENRYSLGDKKMNIDKILGGRHNYFYKPDKKIVLGCVGNRIWASFLESKLGFVGDVNVIHYTDLKDFFTIDILENDRKVEWTETDHIWYPSHLKMKYSNAHLEVKETKFITVDDIGISIISLTNKTRERINLMVKAGGVLFKRANAKEDKHLLNRKTFHGFNFYIGLKISAPSQIEDDSYLRDISLMGKRDTKFVVCFALDTNEESLKEKLHRAVSSDDLLKGHIEEFNGWFEKNIPIFECDDPYFTKLWYYRWYLLRYNLARPGIGHLPYYCFFEGRHGGWFPQLISFSVPVHLMEARWLRDGTYCWDDIRTITQNQFMPARVDHAQKDDPDRPYIGYANWAVGSIWEGLLVHENDELLSEIFNECYRNIRSYIKGWKFFILKNTSGDMLPIIVDGDRAGREYSPSFRYFKDYKADVPQKDIGTYLFETTTPLKSLDVACYHYKNTKAVAAMAKKLGKNELSQKLNSETEIIRTSIYQKTWDQKTKFFYNIRGCDDEKAWVKEGTTFFPFWVGLGQKRFLALFDHLIDEKEFWSKYPTPSIAMDEEAYRSDNTWFGRFIHPCMWNGLNFPYTTSHVIESLGKAIRWRKDLIPYFAKFLTQFTHLQYIRDNFNQPCVFEEYNPQTGEYYNNIHDYFHSYYNDLLIRFVGGLRPREDKKIELDPVDMGWKYFKFDKILYKGKEVTITWRAPDVKGKEVGILRGYRLYINGKLKMNLPKLEKAVCEDL